MSTPSLSSAGKTISRRRFIASTGALLAMPHLVTGQSNTTPPSKKIALGIIGCGGQGSNNMREFLKHADCRIVAACDVDKNHLQNVIRTVNKEYNTQDCKAYHDYRELLARDDIDAVMIAVPDHWHELAAVEAARRKKDIYGEKPLARTIVEQQSIVRAVHEHDRVWQTGSWQRSVSNFHKAAEIVRNGMIGKVSRVEVGLPGGNNDSGHTGQFKNVSEPPPELDYDMWTGPSRLLPYIRARIHKNWRWNYNTGGGQIMDWVGHHCDIAHWGLGFDNSGPLEVDATAEFPPKDAVWNTATKYRVELKYPDDIHMTMAGGYDDIKSGTKWIGDKGWVYVDRGKFEASNDEWSDFKQLPESDRKIKLPISNNHWGNFLECVKSRKPTITPVDTAHHSTIPGHLGLISMLLGRKLKWDNETQTIQNDSEASAMLTRPYRVPWKMD